MICIYSIVNLINGKRYVGSTIDFEKRKKEHLKWLNGNYHHSIALQRAFNKYGLNNFEFNILEIIDNELNLIEREQFYINCKSEYNSNKIAGRPPLQSIKTLVTDINGNEIGIYENKLLAFKSLSIKMSSKKFPFFYCNYLFFSSDSNKEDILNFVIKNKQKMRKLKSIYQFDNELNLLKEWIDIKDILIKYGKTLSNAGITNAIKYKKKAYGFYWSYSKNIENVFNYKGHKKKKVRCYIDKDNYKDFDSITDCAKEMNDQKINIIKVCRKEKTQSKNIYYEYI